MPTLQLHPSILEMAASRVGLTLRELVGRLSTKSTTQEKIANGELTVPQLKKIAKETHIPFGYFLLDSLPEPAQPRLPDLRQTQNSAPLSEAFFETLKDVQKKLDWYADFLKDLGASRLEFIGKFSNQSKNQSLPNAQVVASDICKTLRLPIAKNELPSREAYLNVLIARCETIGILVFRNGIVKNNTRDSLSVDEFRGFVLWDDDHLVPAIFINSKDIPAAQIFTLAHELAHIWIGKQGVLDALPFGHDPIEVLCNQIAANILIPTKAFNDAWEKLGNQWDLLSKQFLVSELAIARVALTHKKITQAEYIAKQQKTKQWFDAFREKQREKPGGPAPLQTIPIRNSNRLTHAVLSQTVNGQMLLRDAARLLNTNPAQIMKLGKKYTGEAR